MLNRLSIVTCLALAACGGGGSSSPDAAVDAPVVAKVAEVTCPATPDATVMTVDGTFSYMPNAVTITQGQVVKFTTSSTHDVAPNTTGSDPALRVGFGATKCFRFTVPGTYGFHCTPHAFTGTITVN
jgi:plastocyanin